MLRVLRSNQNATLDGFQITDGTTNGPSFPQDRAGGILVRGNGALISDCHFIGNRSNLGAALASFSLLRILPTLSLENNDGSSSGGILVFGGEATIINCILWNNTGSNGAQDAANQVIQTANVTYSIVEGDMAGIGNLGSDPMFVDPAGGNYRLSLASGAIDAGNNAGVPIFTLLGADGKERFINELSVPDTGSGTAPIVDMDAFEFQGDLGSSDPTACPWPTPPAYLRPSPPPLA